MKHYYFWTVFVVIFVVELYSVLPPRNVTLPKENLSSSRNFAQGVIHVHSKFSDGGGTPEEIAQAADQAGLDFVIVTDHNNYEARKRGLEGTYGKADLFVEMESSTPVGHTVSFFSESDSLREAPSDTVVKASYQQFLKKEFYPGLFVSIAHPSNMKNPWSRLDEFAEGLEVVNFDSSWQRQVAESPLNFLFTLAIYPFNQYLSSIRFLEIYSKDFVAWDEMTSRGPGHFAYLAQDTHSKVKLNNERSLEWPGYLQTFKLASNVLLFKEPKATDFLNRKKQYYSSLRNGRSAILYQSVFPYQGNSWIVKCGNNEFISGDIINNGSSSCQAVITAPITPFTKIVRLIKNGKMTNEVALKGDSMTPLNLALSGEGTYRVEVWGKMHSAFRLTLNRLVPYVFYSPIYFQ